MLKPEEFEPKNKEENKEETSVLEKEDFQEFIKDREIAPEDFEMIEKLSHFPKRLFGDFHNFFNFNRENSIPALKNQIKYEEEELEGPIAEERKSLAEERIAFYKSLLEFTRKYEWPTAWHLNRVFERNKKDESHVQSRKNKN